MTIGVADTPATGARTATRTVAAEPQDVAAGAALDVLAAGGLVALPTETVYGLAADARSSAAVARLYAAKGRPAHNPLIVHVACLDDAAPFADVEAARALATLWPGPLTVVLPARPGIVAPAALAGGATVAVRVPATPLFRAVAAAFGPLVAPSANRSGRVSSTTAAAVAEELDGRIDLIIDGGPTALGVESTVVDLTGRPTLLRPGAMDRRAIEARVGPLRDHDASGGALRAPGLLASHYAPRARLRLDVAPQEVRPDEGWLALGEARSAAAEEHTVRLSRTNDLDEAARGLYEGLRRLDATGVEVIAVSPVVNEGIGTTIRDRLRRAAAPRD
ncbi:L-threonylcarbamoyladenylate synthase [Acuticoccus sp.]|uniref:L-threonylcarbamoyladenylate synthase n=1 Tax=Acuticoccus sp. TaxID=1904378 RepID=UPI003B52E32D